MRHGKKPALVFARAEASKEQKLKFMGMKTLPH